MKKYESTIDIPSPTCLYTHFKAEKATSRCNLQDKISLKAWRIAIHPKENAIPLN